MTDKAQKAQMLYDAGLYRQAGVLLQQAMAEEPADSANYCLLSNIECNLNRRSESLEAARRAVSLSPDHFYAHLCLANALYVNYKREEALLEAKAAMSLNPQFCGCYVIAARISIALSAPAVALQYAEDGLKIDALSVGCLSQKAIALRALGRAPEAEAIDKARLAAHPDDPGSHLARGYGAAHSQDLDLMLEHFKSALKISPNCDFSHFAIATGYSRKGLHDLAEEHARMAYQIDPGAIDNVLLYANALAKRAAYHESMMVLRKAYELYPDSSEILYHLADLALRVKDWNLADELMAKFMAQNPHSQEGYYLKVLRRLESEEYGVILQLTREALEHHPDSDQLRVQLVVALAKTGDFELAYEQCARIGDGITAYEKIKVLTLVDCEQKQFDRAIKRLDKIASDAPDLDEFAGYIKALVYKKWTLAGWLQGRYVASQKLLEQCSKQNNDKGFAHLLGSLNRAALSFVVFNLSLLFGLVSICSLAMDPIGRHYLKKTELQAGLFCALFLAVEAGVIVYCNDICFWILSANYKHALYHAGLLLSIVAWCCMAQKKQLIFLRFILALVIAGLSLLELLIFLHKHP
ncbi:MAG: hypothetical protein IPP97_07915 [Candidatus Obscuribacter sp.]|nr:hypothetical protein [Candidatus Obscuribacter sp.]